MNYQPTTPPGPRTQARLPGGCCRLVFYSFCLRVFYDFGIWGGKSIMLIKFGTLGLGSLGTLRGIFFKIVFFFEVCEAPQAELEPQKKRVSPF